MKNPRHLAALRRENSKSLKTGDFPDKQQSPAEKSQVIEIHPLVLNQSCGRGERGTTGKAGAELCIHSAASGGSARSSGGQAVRRGKKGVRTRLHCTVIARAKWRAQIKAVKLIVPLSDAPAPPPWEADVR